MTQSYTADFKNILIIQTAFAGDVILTLPVLEEIKFKYPDSKISFLCIPEVANLLENNPFLDEVIIYDKKNSQKGIFAFKKFIKKIKNKNFDLIVSPHRSLRSTLISYFSKVSRTISFDVSALSSLYKERVIYKNNVHEIIRNLSLLAPIGILKNEIITPKLFPSEKDKGVVDKLLKDFKFDDDEKFITIAPGSVWLTKAYPDTKYAKVINILNDFAVKIVMIGGEDDFGLCAKIKVLCKNLNIYNAAGKLTYLQSVELIRRSKVLLTNDSAPLHLANAVGTKVIAIFGATVPEFGFYPYGKNDVIFQTSGLKCRPCSIHGGNRCPIKTFDCMVKIDETDVALDIMKSVIA
jgi:heptosyltransferase II